MTYLTFITERLCFKDGDNTRCRGVKLWELRVMIIELGPYQGLKVVLASIGFS